jgi:hypothetical protein
VRLEVVADNRGAIALYEVLGFVPYGGSLLRIAWANVSGTCCL